MASTKRRSQSTLTSWLGTAQKKPRLDIEETTSCNDEPLDASRATGEGDVHSAPSEAQLSDLLDFSTFETSDSALLAARFDQLANALLHEYSLVVTSGPESEEYHILELEFYLRASGHEDPFTHGSEEQRLAGNWYFHRAPRRSADPNKNATSSTAYRSGSRKGLDITIGIPSTKTSHYDIRGGILLRTIQRRSDFKVISGPSLLVDEILRESSAESITELVDEKWGKDRSAFLSSTSISSSRTSLYLNPSSADARRREATIYSSPRIGLDLSHPITTASPSNSRVIYVSKPYRYFVHPTLLTSNGRCQTLLGVYKHCGEGAAGSEKLHHRLSALTGIKIQTVAKYMRDFQTGFSERSLKKFVGAPGKGVCSSPANYLQMMGTLRAIQQE